MPQAAAPAAAGPAQAAGLTAGPGEGVRWGWGAGRVPACPHERWLRAGRGEKGWSGLACRDQHTQHTQHTQGRQGSGGELSGISLQAANRARARVRDYDHGSATVTVREVTVAVGQARHAAPMEGTPTATRPNEKQYQASLVMPSPFPRLLASPPLPPTSPKSPPPPPVTHLVEGEARTPPAHAPSGAAARREAGPCRGGTRVRCTWPPALPPSHGSDE